MTINTTTSPTGAGALPAGTTPIGGVVVDIVGANGVRVVAQLAASDMFVGFFDSGTPSGYNGNPGTAGILSGLSPATIAALGGGIQKMAVRVTIYDGDSADGNFDDGDNTFLINGTAVGNFSDVITDRTDSSGSILYTTEAGFQNDTLNTGWFSITNASQLAAIYSSLSSTGSLSFKVSDVDPYDNFYDFTQGLDGELVDVGSPPNTAPVTAADLYNAAFNTTISVNAANGVLKNDYDVEGTALTATLVTTTANGTLTFNSNGSFTYKPNAGFTGTDSFIYNATDGALSTAQLVTIDVGTPTTPTVPGTEIRGGKGNDNLVGTTGNDSIRAKAGDDTINGGTGDDFITGDAGNDNITAGKGNDRVDGGEGNDIIYGREGNDLLMGGTGDDRIMGDAGNDIIYGQTGNDNLSGGSGFDVFFFGIADGNDTITDFTAGEDKLNLHQTGLSFADLTITTDATGTSVQFGTTSVLLKNVGSVSASDFVF